MDKEVKINKVDIAKQGRETLDFYEELIKKDPSDVEF